MIKTKKSDFFFFSNCIIYNLIPISRENVKKCVLEVSIEKNPLTLKKLEDFDVDF